MRRASERLSLGFEAFSEPEAQAHYFGPRASFAIGDVSLSAGYLAGFDDARADGQITPGAGDHARPASGA